METVNIFDSCVLLSLTVHIAGNSAKGDIGQIQTEADKELLRLNKKLLDCPEYDALREAATAIRKIVQQKCFGGQSKTIEVNGKKYQVGKGLSSLLKRGVYLVPVEIVPTVQDLLESTVPAFDLARARFCEVYEARKAEARERLKGQYAEKDYPPVESVKRACHVEYSYLTIGVPQSLEGVRAGLFEAEKAKAAARWSEATDEIRLVLRAGLKELIDHMADKLQPNPDGKKKRLHETAIAGFKEFLADFPAKNLTDDAELAALVERTQAVLAGKTVEDLRTDDAIREQVAKGIGEVKTALASLVEDVPTRAILIED